MGLYDRDLRAVLGEIAGPTPAPGAGAVSGIVTAMAAGLIASAARRSPGLGRGARGLRAGAGTPVARREARRGERGGVPRGARADRGVRKRKARRDAAIGKALDTAAELPLSIAECAYDVALLGCEAAQHAAPGGAEDACAASLLAEAAARAAAGLDRREPRLDPRRRARRPRTTAGRRRDGRRQARRRSLGKPLAGQCSPERGRRGRFARCAAGFP